MMFIILAARSSKEKKSKMPDLQKRLMSMAEYHCAEWAERLEEIGGPGVGGTELAYYPHFVHQAGNKDEYIRMALEGSIPRTWDEASWCYVYGQFRACVLLCAAILELALKYELYRKDEIFRRDEFVWPTLGRLINRCFDVGVLSEPLVSKARSVNTRRNDVIHANIQTARPKSLLNHSGDEHEIEPIKDLSKIIGGDGSLTGDGETISASFGKGRGGYSRIYAFKKAARSSLLDVREILRFLYPVVRDR
jgi:hypothetical protein